jgi:hypothetical protein
MDAFTTVSEMMERRARRAAWRETVQFAVGVLGFVSMILLLIALAYVGGA